MSCRQPGQKSNHNLDSRRNVLIAAVRCAVHHHSYKVTGDRTTLFLEIGKQRSLEREALNENDILLLSSTFAAEKHHYHL